MQPPAYNREVSPYYYSRFNNMALTKAEYASPMTIYRKPRLNLNMSIGTVLILLVTYFIWATL